MCRPVLVVVARFLSLSPVAMKNVQRMIAEYVHVDTVVDVDANVDTRAELAEVGRIVVMAPLSNAFVDFVVFRKIEQKYKAHRFVLPVFATKGF